MDKELHVWLRRIPNRDDPYLHQVCLAESYDDVQKALERNDERIDTYCTHFFNTKTLEKGYRLFAHLPARYYFEPVEIRIGANKYTQRNISYGHHLERLLLSGEFGAIDNVCDDVVLDWRQVNRDFEEANKDAPPGRGYAIATTPTTARKGDGTPLMRSEATEAEVALYKSSAIPDAKDLQSIDKAAIIGKASFGK